MSLDPPPPNVIYVYGPLFDPTNFYTHTPVILPNPSPHVTICTGNPTIMLYQCGLSFPSGPCQALHILLYIYLQTWYLSHATLDNLQLLNRWIISLVSTAVSLSMVDKSCE